MNFKQWFSSLNENGRVTYFLGQEGRVSEEAWNYQQAKIDELQKRIDEISGYATELAEYASYAEIVGGVSHNQSAIREYCDKIFAYNRAIDLEEEKALRGEHENN